MLVFVNFVINHYGNTLTPSVFFYFHIVNRFSLLLEFPTPIATFMGLHSNTNLHCLENLAPGISRCSAVLEVLFCINFNKLHCITNVVN